MRILPVSEPLVSLLILIAIGVLLIEDGFVQTRARMQA